MSTLKISLRTRLALAAALLCGVTTSAMSVAVYAVAIRLLDRQRSAMMLGSPIERNGGESFALGKTKLETERGHELRASFRRLVFGAALLALACGGAGGWLLAHSFTRPLVENLQRMELAVQASSEGLWDWQLGTNEFWLAPRFKELLGYPRDEFPDRLPTWESLTHPDDREPMHQVVRAHLNDNEPFDVEIRLMTKSGNYRWFRARGIASRDRNGQPGRMSGTIQDLTDRKTVEELLRQNAEELRHCNDELERFAYVASHDLKEPLRMVASYTQLLAEAYKGRLDEEAEQYIGYAVDGARWMQALIDDLLAYSRIGRTRDFVNRIDLRGLVESVVSDLEPFRQAHGAEVKVGELPMVCGSVTLLMQLFENLLSNAIKFHGARSSEVRVSYEEVDGECVFAVADNGIGISAEQHERIFQMFKRLHRRGQYEGTGIGLPICRKIVEQHRGRIWVKSGLAEGSTFYFTLPVERVIQPQQHEEPRAELI